MDLEFWNNLKKDSETDATAEEGDLLTIIGGVAFLIQRRNDYNNVICIRVQPSRQSIKETILEFRLYCIQKEIQYIRVEGTTQRYNFLKKIAPEGCCVHKHWTESKALGRNVFYIKLY